MKNFLNLNQLSMSWNEKQKPQRLRRYAVMLLMLLTLGVGQMWADYTHVIAVAGENPNDYTVKVEANIGDNNTKWMYTFSQAGLTYEGKKLYVGYYNEKYGGVNGLDIHYYSGSTWKSKCSPFTSWTTSLNDNQVYNKDACSWYGTVTVETGARFYFDASTWDETSIKLVVGHANYQRYSSLTNVTNTKLYYGKSGNKWTDAMAIGVVGNTTASDGTNYFSDISSKASEYTGLKRYGLTSTGDHNAYLMVPTGDTGEQPNMSYNNSHKTLLNSTQTIKYAVSTNGGTATELTSGYVPADIAISSYEFTNSSHSAVYASTASASLTKNGSYYSSTITAARTATTTLTVSNVDDDYAFLGWYSAASGGTQLADAEHLSYTYYPTAATTVYARFSHENNHTVTISRYCTSTSTEINNTSAKIGEITYSSISAPEIYGYTFVNWSLGSGVTKHTSDALTANPIRVKTNDSGSGYTLTANYTEVLTTDWKVIGDNQSGGPFGDNYSYSGSTKAMSKKTGHSSEHNAYVTINVTKLPGDNYGFKVASSSSDDDKWGYGTGDGAYITFNRSASGVSKQVYSGSQHQLKFVPDGLGEYEFRVHYPDNKYVYVYFPTNVDVVTFGKGTGGNTVTAKYSDVSFSSGTKVERGKTVTFTQSASSGYEFKEWNTNSSGTGTKLSEATSYDHTVVATNNVYAIFKPKSYTVSYAAESNFAYTVKPTTGTYGQTVSITITPSQDYKITGVTAKKTGDASTSVTVTHTAATNVWTFTQPAYGVTVTPTASAYGLTASISSKSYENRTFTLSKSSTYNPEGTLNTNWFVYYVCTSKPAGASCDINQSTGVATVDKDGDYTFKVQYRTAAAGEGTLLAESSGVTGAMRTIPDRSGLTISHAKYSNTYMSGDGASETPYFVYLSRATDYGKLSVSATLPAALLTGEKLYYSVDDSEIGEVPVAGTAASVAMDLPNKTVGAGRSTVIKFYSKLDNQVAPSAKMASATAYYTICANPVVTVNATYNGTPVTTQLPQGATIVLSASVTDIPGDPTFTYSKGDGEYSSTTSYTISEAATTAMHAKTTYLGDDWIGTKNITTYTVNPVTYTTHKTDMYGDETSSSTTRNFKSDGESHTAAEYEGYTFTGWTCSNSNVQVSDDSGETWKTTSSNATVYVKATAAGGTLTANYTENKRIYFDNSKAKWSGNIYVYFFSGDSWYNNYNSSNKNGPGVVPRINQIGYGQMTRIGSSDIYYYEYGALSFTDVAFSIHNQYNYDMLYNTKGAWRRDFSACNPCYVAPETSDQTKYNTGGDGKSGDNKPTYYYNSGYWRRYMPAKSGYTLHFADQELDFLPEDPSVDAENFKVTVLRAASTTYPIYVNNSCRSKTWKNSSAITKDNCTNLTLTQTSGTVNFTTTAEGYYVFRLSTADGKVRLTVEYPLSEGDYRVLYSDVTGNNNNTSNYIRMNTGEEAKDDIVSFFVKHDETPTYTIERCTGFSGTTPTWETAVTATAISVAKDSVYNFTFRQPAGGASIALTGTPTPYSGNYYIRTDAAAGGWGNYLSNSDNIMKYTDKASALAAGYNYYYLRWVGDASGNSTANVKFCVATDYNDCVSQEFANDPVGGNIEGKQALTGKGANVRFTYHPGTNNMTRSYIGGSAHDANYLVISGTNLKKSDGSAWATSAMEDQNDWIYTLNLKAANDATIELQSHYNSTYVTVLPSETVLKVDDENYYDLRIIYDYKTNEVVAAYIPGEVTSELTIDVDIMFIRQALDNYDDEAEPTTLTFSGGGKITGEPKTLYGAIQFEKDYVRGESTYSGLNRSQRSTYWISFPFDVRVSDIFGLGEYTETWILRRYRGDLRASKGWFLETSSFWEYIFDTDYVLKAGEGYVLSIDCEAIQWPNSKTTQYLYFPSKDKIEDIESVLPSANLAVPSHTCSITSPADRTIKDSHWNVIGIPGFGQAWGKASATVSTIDGDFHYFYSWDPTTNTLSSESTKKYQFKFMHSYMVQYTGDIVWSASEPAAVPARRAANAKPEEVEFRLELMQGEQEADHTFITLMDKEQITTGFDMNTDLVKMFNANKSNIYTVINSDVQAAANCLPMTEQTTLVPVGVQVKTDGEYTFAIPEGTHGVGVTLIDNETGISTSLSALDYTIYLAAGTYNNRFVLEISPIQHTPTGIENSEFSDQHSDVRKVIIDQQMYIIRGNEIFDARGAKVK